MIVKSVLSEWYVYLSSCNERGVFEMHLILCFVYRKITCHLQHVNFVKRDQTSFHYTVSKIGQTFVTGFNKRSRFKKEGVLLCTGFTIHLSLSLSLLSLSLSLSLHDIERAY